MKTTGNTILITGAGTGMGLEAAKQFSQRGNTIIMVARNKERLQAEAARLENASVLACDIADAAGRPPAPMLAERHPDLNVTFLNAGVTHTYSLFSHQDAFGHAQQEMTVNFLSAVRLTQELEPRLSQRPEAAMIITTSGAAMAPDISNPTYSATKAALHSLPSRCAWSRTSKFDDQGIRADGPARGLPVRQGHPLRAQNPAGRGHRRPAHRPRGAIRGRSTSLR